MPGVSRRDLVAVLLFCVPLLAAMKGASGPRVVRLNLGPGDAPYISGFTPEYEITQGKSAQWSRRDAAVALPLRISGGPITLVYRYSRPLPEDAMGAVSLGDAPVDRFVPRRSSDERSVSLAALPPTAVDVRFQVASGDPRGLGLRLEWIRLEMESPSRVRLSGFPLVRPALLALLIYVVLRLAGWSAFASLAWTLPWCLATTAGLLVDPWLVHRLMTGLPEWLAPLGLAGVAIAVWLRSRGRLDGESVRMVTALGVTAFLFRAALFNHPDYYYSDLRIHAKLAEMVRIAGWDFFRTPARYIVEHKAWSREIDGQTYAFPYTPVFHALFAPTSLSVDGLVSALKLGAAVATVVPILALWSLCRRWGSSTLGCVLLLFVPIYVHHLGLAYQAALFGHAVDLIFLAWLARRLDGILTPKTFAVAALFVTVCQLSYVTAVIVLPIFLGLLAAFVFLEERNGAGLRRAAAVLAFGALGSLLAILVYYRHFSPLLTHALSHAVRGTPVVATDDAPKRPFLEVLWIFTRKYFDYLWAPAAVAGFVVLLRRRVGRPLMAAWAATYLLLLFGRAHMPFVFQHPHDALFVTPLVCLAAGEAVAFFARDGGWKRVAAYALFACLALHGLFVQWQEWSRHLASQ